MTLEGHAFFSNPASIVKIYWLQAAPNNKHSVPASEKSNMKLPIIGDKEIVSVRLIPFIANAWLGHVTLAGIFANMVRISGWPFPSDNEQFEVSVYDEETDRHETKLITRADLIGPQKRNNGVITFYLNDDNEPVAMRASEWEVFYRDISVLEPVLRKVEQRNEVTNSMEAVWRLKATTVLPPGVFLWKDDLELLWKAHISSFINATAYDPSDFRKMNYDAYVRPEYRELVWEGFENLMPSNSEPESVRLDSTPPFDVDEQLTSYRLAVQCNRTNCSTCNKHDCRNQLAHELSKKFGDHTEHKLHLWKIGVALGLPEPTWARDRDDKVEMERQKKEVGAIKSKVRRWIDAHSKKDTPSHPIITP